MHFKASQLYSASFRCKFSTDVGSTVSSFCDFLYSVQANWTCATQGRHRLLPHPFQFIMRLSWQCKLLKKFVYKDHNETTHYYMTCDQFCRPYARQHVQQAEILIQTKFTVNTSSLRAACRCCNVQVTALLMFIIHRTSDRCCDAVGQFSYANC